MNFFYQLLTSRKKYSRENNSPFVNKIHSSAHMRQNRPRSEFLRIRTEANKMVYTKQGNYCVQIQSKTTKD